MQETHIVPRRTSHLRTQQAKYCRYSNINETRYFYGMHNLHRLKSPGLVSSTEVKKQRSNRIQIGVQHRRGDQSEGVVML
jgi:hypothetical protein